MPRTHADSRPSFPHAGKAALCVYTVRRVSGIGRSGDSMAAFSMPGSGCLNAAQRSTEAGGCDSTLLKPTWQPASVAPVPSVSHKVTRYARLVHAELFCLSSARVCPDSVKQQCKRGALRPWARRSFVALSLSGERMVDGLWSENGGWWRRKRNPALVRQGSAFLCLGSCARVARFPSRGSPLRR